jgi:peptide/nickel transport system permease protein
MLAYIGRRLILLIPTVFVISVVSFVIIQLPPGDFLTAYISNLESQGQFVDQSAVQALRQQYGLDQPKYVQYLKWVGGMLHGNFGHSFQWRQPVSELIWDRLGLTLALSAASVLLIWAVAFPVGIYSAIRQYSPGDYLFTFLSFVGLGVPSFLLALVVMWFALRHHGWRVVLTGVRQQFMEHRPPGRFRPAPVDPDGRAGHRRNGRTDPDHAGESAG